MGIKEAVRQRRPTQGRAGELVGHVVLIITGALMRGGHLGGGQPIQSHNFFISEQFFLM